MDKSISINPTNEMPANERGTGRTTRTLKRAYEYLEKNGGTVFVITSPRGDQFGYMCRLLLDHVEHTGKMRVFVAGHRIDFPGVGTMQFMRDTNPLYVADEQRVIGEPEDRVFMDHLVVEQYCLNLVNRVSR